MVLVKSTVTACANLALIKYWGNEDEVLNIPKNDSISVSLEQLTSTTSVELGYDLDQELILNHKKIGGSAHQRFEKVVTQFRKMTGINEPVRAISENNFPTAAGIASSASGFGALAHALYEASGLDYTATDVSRLARIGSGSAARTVFPGYVLWKSGMNNETSVAEQIAPPNDLRVLVAITTHKEKSIPSNKAMEMSKKHSPFYLARSNISDSHIEPMIKAIQNWDFQTVGEITQKEANNLHAVINTTNMGLFYWKTTSIEIIQKVIELQKEIPCYYTMDAGPQVKILVEPDHVNLVRQELQSINTLEKIIESKVGFGSQVIL